MNQQPPRIEATLLQASNVGHGFFTRIGGVSSGLYESLNCGFGSNDRREDVTENRARVALGLGVAPARLVTLRQTHSAKASIIDKPPLDGVAIEADAVVTSQRGLAVAVLTADCAPVLLADFEAGVFAAAHAGWRGALGGIIEATVDAMQSLDAKPERIRAAVGPCISRAAYEVGEEFKSSFTAKAAEYADFFHAGPNAGKPHFDLPRFVLHRLASKGVMQAQSSSPCTFENESKFFSYRRTQKRGEADYGRQISAIVLL